MKINIVFIFIYLIINYSLISTISTTIINNVFQIEDVTKNKIIDSYTIQADLEYCTFLFDITATCINNDNGVYGYPNITTQDPDSIVFLSAYQTILNNDTLAIYKLLYNSYPTSSPISTNVTLSGCGYSGVDKSIYQVSFQCHEINVSALKFEMTNMSFSYIYQFHTVIKITGLLYPLKIGLLTSMSDGYYFYQTSAYDGGGTTTEYYDSYTIGNITTILKIGSQQISLSSPPYQSLSSINVASDFKSYPSDLNDTKEFNQQYKCPPVSTFKIKSVSTPPIIFTLNENVYNVQSYFPLYGEGDGSMTYLQTLDYLSYENVNAYLYTQNGDQFKSFSNISFKYIRTMYYSKILDIQNTQLNGHLVFNINTSDTKYDFLPLSIYFKSASYLYSFPYGFSQGTLNDFTYDVNFLYSNDTIYFTFGFYEGIANSFSASVPSTDTSPPIVENIEVKLISDIHYIVVLHLSDESGIEKISISGVIFGIESLSQGTVYDGVFEFVIPLYLIPMSSIVIYDKYQNEKRLDTSTFYSINPIKYYSSLSSGDRFGIGSVSSITYESYEMDLTNSFGYNTIYFNFSGNQIQYPFYLIFPTTNNIFLDGIPTAYPSNWDDVKRVYYINFVLKKNGYPLDDLQWIFVVAPDQRGIVNTAFYEKIFKPCIVKSSTPDLSGPLITNIVKLAGDGIVTNLNTNPLATVGWNITIEDKNNGFSHGYIVVQGLVDGSINNFTLNSNNADKSITFTVLLSNMSCVDQAYQINQIKLYDTVNMITGFDYSGATFYQYSSLLYYNNDLDILRVNVSCIPSSIDSTPPILLSITPNASTIDLGSNDRAISFTIKVQDLESGINIGQSPIVYISSTSFNIIECKSKLINCTTKDHLECIFKCEVEIPFKFTTTQLIYQLYGIWNKQGIFNGYSYSKLSTSIGGGIIASTFSTNIPIITSTNRITNEPNFKVVIIGRYIGDTELVNIKYSNGQIDSIAPTDCSFSYCTIQLQGSNETFTIQLQLKDKSLSNIYTVTPLIVGNFKYSSSSSSSSSSIEYTCPGQPVCGGSSNGYCSSKGCICISPWYGIECKQKIIVVPQPSLNGTDPNITIILPPNENNNNSNHQIEYTSLTSIISLREIDINKQPIQTHPFSKWFNNQINSTLNEYYSNFTNINNIDKTTQVKVTVQWFNNQTNITFADTQFTINPSSIKYTIEIKDYPFKNKLNSLEIVMSASFKSNKDESCSSKEFGASNGYDNSDYLKLQVNDHSLYSRFIKRGIIDGNKTVSITNTLLDDSFTSTNQASETQSYIGISIPNFDNIAIVDPDFSVMLDYSKSSSNSVCNKSSRLTSSQIAGIIIGSVGFALVITISAVYYHIKKKRDLKAVQNLSNKLKSIS